MYNAGGRAGKCVGYEIYAVGFSYDCWDDGGINKQFENRVAF